MSTSHRLARSMAVAIPAILLVATAAFAHSSNFSAAPAGTWTDKPDITNVGVVGDHEDVWEDADDGASDRDEIDDQVGANDDGEAEAADQTEVDEPDGAETHVQHAKPDKAPKADAGAADDANEDDNDQGENEDNDDQGDAENHDGSHDGANDGGDGGGESDDGGGDD
jgi:hypothetical protein